MIREKINFRIYYWHSHWLGERFCDPTWHGMAYPDWLCDGLLFVLVRNVCLTMNPLATVLVREQTASGKCYPIHTIQLLMRREVKEHFTGWFYKVLWRKFMKDDTQKYETMLENCCNRGKWLLLPFQGPVSRKSPENFRAYYGYHNSLSIFDSQRRGSKPSNLAILLVFLALKTC